MSPSIIELAVKSSAIIAVAAVAAGLMQRRASAASRHLVWTLAVAALLVLPLATVALPSWNIPIRRQMPSLAVSQPPAPIAIESSSAPTLNAAAESTADAQGSPKPPLSFMAILPIAYVAGVVFLLGRLGI